MTLPFSPSNLPDSASSIPAIRAEFAGKGAENGELDGFAELLGSLASITPPSKAVLSQIKQAIRAPEGEGLPTGKELPDAAKNGLSPADQIADAPNAETLDHAALASASPDLQLSASIAPAAFTVVAPQPQASATDAVADDAAAVPAGQLTGGGKSERHSQIDTLMVRSSALKAAPTAAAEAVNVQPPSPATVSAKASSNPTAIAPTTIDLPAATVPKADGLLVRVSAATETSADRANSVVRSVEANLRPTEAKLRPAEAINARTDLSAAVKLGPTAVLSHAKEQLPTPSQPGANPAPATSAGSTANSPTLSAIAQPAAQPAAQPSAQPPAQPSASSIPAPASSPAGAIAADQNVVRSDRYVDRGLSSDRETALRSDAAPARVEPAFRNAAPTAVAGAESKPMPTAVEPAAAANAKPTEAILAAPGAQVKRSKAPTGRSSVREDAAPTAPTADRAGGARAAELESAMLAARAATIIDSAKSPAASLALQSDGALNLGRPGSAAPTPVVTDPFANVERVVDHIMSARQVDLSKPASIAVAHRDFGALTVTFDQSTSGGMNVEIAAESSEAQRALAAAIAQDRGTTRQQDLGVQPATAQNPSAATGSDRGGSAGQAGTGLGQGSTDDQRSQHSEHRGRQNDGTTHRQNPPTPQGSDDALYA